MFEAMVLEKCKRIRLFFVMSTRCMFSRISLDLLCGGHLTLVPCTDETSYRCKALVFRTGFVMPGFVQSFKVFVKGRNHKWFCVTHESYADIICTFIRMRTFYLGNKSKSSVGKITAHYLWLAWCFCLIWINISLNHEKTAGKKVSGGFYLGMTGSNTATIVIVKHRARKGPKKTKKNSAVKWCGSGFFLQYRHRYYIHYVSGCKYIHIIHTV